MRYGRFGGQTKEKYGTIRFYAHMGYLNLHALIYPGYVFSQFPDWLWSADIYYIGPALRFFFERPFYWWNKKVYNWAYQRCLTAYPHLRGPLLCGADWPEFISGATRIEGNKKHVIGWNGEILSTWVTRG